MREIKFRGKKKDGEWIYGYGYIYCHKYYNITGEAAHFIPDIYGDRQGRMVDGKTVGQYIGQKDKNGKEIYEGDIIKYFNDKYKYIVKYDQAFAQYSLSINYDNNDSIRYICDFNYVEVIGNIYDNPELLGEKNNE